MEEVLKLRAIFAPHEMRRRKELIDKGKRLIHYTSATSAMSIIRNKQIWMRNVRCMNDFMEVEHGFDMLVRANSKTEDDDSETERGLIALRTELEKVFPDIATHAVTMFNSALGSLRHNSYVTCLSEHDQSENDIGRLSMWRSYGSSQVGIGLVINPAPLYSFADQFGAYSSPVYYMNDNELLALLLEVRDNITQNADFIRSQDQRTIEVFFFMLLRSLAICSKHPGFHEEQEWRIMHTDNIDVRGVLEMGVECVNGVPQKVYKIHLDDRPDVGMVGISIPSFLERVIIGPTQYPLAVYDAIVHELELKHVPNARDKVVFSNIPLRT